jgi:hypothetical protein
MPIITFRLILAAKLNTARDIKTLILGCLIWLSTLHASVAASGWDTNMDAVCPEAAREHYKLLEGRPVPKDVSVVSRPALQAELLQMQQEDQAARAPFIAALNAHGGDLPMDDPTRLAAIRVDEGNLLKLKHIIAQDGFPTIAMVGLEGVHAAFLLTQHADEDPKFQDKMLRVITVRLRQGEVGGNEFALLTDRVLRAQGKPQLFGTQFTGIGENLKPLPIADEAHVDERRRSIGLMSIAHYACILHAHYDPPRSSTAN